MNATTDGFTIDAEFAELCPQPTNEERNLLMASIDAEGCREALIVWDEQDILIDGHTRKEICDELSVDYRVNRKSLPSRDAAIEWIIANQLGRRNVTEEQKGYLRGKRYQQEKKKHGGDRKSSVQDEHLKTAERIGEQLGVSPTTVRRDARFAQAVDEIAKHSGKETRDEILAGKSPLSKEKVTALAGKPADEQKSAIEQAKNPSIKKAPAMPSLMDEKLTKSEQEAQVVRDEFQAHLAKICDGGVYTVDTLADATGITRTSVHWFIRMCEVSPAVVVHRNFGRKGLTQYSFVKTNCVEGSERIRQLAEQIATDPASSSKSCAAANRILTLLGG